MEPRAKKREPQPTDIHTWHWKHKGFDPVDQVTIRPAGTMKAPRDASSRVMGQVDKDLRKQFPRVRWMHGKEMETDPADKDAMQISYGPTVWRGKFVREGVPA